MLRSFLPSVVRFSEADGAVVYVADNGSTDASVAMLRREFPSVHLILLEENHGFADGYNLALKQVEAEYVVLLNSDVEVTEHWLVPLAEYMDAYPETAACQPKIRSWRNKGQFEYAGAAGGFIDRYGYPLLPRPYYGRGRRGQGAIRHGDTHFLGYGGGSVHPSGRLPGSGWAGRTFFAHMEEIDLCWRLRARGRQLACIPQSVVFHVGGATLKKENPRKTFLNFRNNLVMLYKNLPQEDLASVMRVRAVLDYVAAFSFMLKGQLPNALAVFRARRAYHSLRTSLAASRKENLKKTTLAVIPERTKNSILAQFYLHGKKFFSQL